MPEPSHPRAFPWAGRDGLVLAAVLAVGAWPHRFALDLWPTTRDAVVWIARTDPSRADWGEWIFLSDHFKVGYRPVTALSYALGHLAGGGAAWPWRTTDLALHLGVAVALVVFVRRLAPELPRWGALVAGALFVAHPVGAVVVPSLARRSYSLSTCLALTGLLVLCTGARAPPGWRDGLRGIAGAWLLAAAGLATETAWPALLVVPALVLPRLWTHPWRLLRGALRIVPPLVLGGAALAFRSWVLQGSGGYAAEGRLELAPTIAELTWTRALALQPIESDGLLLPAAVGVVLATAWLALASASLSGSRNRAALAALLAWAGLLTLVYLPQGVWFSRQLYPLAVPVCAVAGLLAAEPGPVRQRALRLVPVVLLAIATVARSPILHGPHPGRALSMERTDALMRAADADLGGLSRGDTALLVLPFYTRPELASLRARQFEDVSTYGARGVTRWLQFLHRRPALELRALVVTEPSDPRPTVDWPVDAIAGVVAADRLVWTYGGQPKPRATGAGQRLELSVGDVEPPVWLYLHDGQAGELRPLDADVGP